MAVGVSGVIQHTLYNDYYIAKHGYSYVDVYYREEYDVASNTSVIVIPQITFRHSKYGGTWHVHGSVTIDGTVYYFESTSMYSGGVIENAITSKPIYHDGVTGEKSIVIETACNTMGGTGGTQFYAGNHGTATVTVPLTTIPRISAVGAADGVIGEAVGITIDRSSSLFTHTLRYRFGEATGVIAENTSATELLWTPPMELCSRIPDRASAACSIICETYNGESIIGSRETTITLTVPPEVGLVPVEGWATVQPYHPMIGESGITAYVQGYSAAEGRFDAGKISLANAYGAGIAGFSVVFEGESIQAPYRTPMLERAGVHTVDCVVTDTRGRSITQTREIFVEPYRKPAVGEAEIFRCHSDGTEDDEGTYVSANVTGTYSSLGGENRVAINLRVGDLFTAELPNGSPAIVGGGAVLHTATYPVTVTVTDRLGNEGVYTQLLPTADVMFHGRKGGRGAAFGKYAEQDDLLEVDWNLRVRKHLAVDGEVTVGGKPLINLLAEQVDPLRYMPVGYVYLSLDATSPAALFGGTWERIASRFLYGVYDGYAGATGGEESHYLSVNELPWHEHYVGIGGGGNYVYWGEGLQSTSRNSWGFGYQDNKVANTLVAQGAGSGASHNNMPPWYGVYMWRRVE